MGTIKASLTLDDMIDFLNELLSIDRPAIAALIANRVPCNQAMADHESVQVMSQHGGYHVGMLGILNGLWGTFNGIDGPIAVIWDNGTLIKFAKRQDFISSTEG